MSRGAAGHDIAGRGWDPSCCYGSGICADRWHGKSPGQRENGAGVLEAEEARAGACGMDSSGGLGLEAILLGTDSGTNARCQMVCVGTGLPPIPRRIVEKIQNHEFVEFTELPTDETPIRG